MHFTNKSGEGSEAGRTGKGQETNEAFFGGIEDVTMDGTGGCYRGRRPGGGRAWGFGSVTRRQSGEGLGRCRRHSGTDPSQEFKHSLIS